MLTGWTEPSLWHSLVLMLPETKLPGFPFLFIFSLNAEVMLKASRGSERPSKKRTVKMPDTCAQVTCPSQPTYRPPPRWKVRVALPKEMQPHRGLALVGEKEQLWGPGERTPQAVCGRDPSDPLCTSCRGRAVETECPLYQTAGKVIKTHGLGPRWKPHRHQAEQLARLPRISYLLSSPQRRKVCHWGDTFKRKDIICYFSVLSLFFFLNSGNGAFLVDKALGAIGERKKNITTNRLLCASTFALFSFHLRYKLTNKSMEW